MNIFEVNNRGFSFNSGELSNVSYEIKLVIVLIVEIFFDVIVKDGSDCICILIRVLKMDRKLISN